LLFWSCKDESALQNEIAKVAVDYTVERFDIDFARATPADLPLLKTNYPFLFPKHVPDSIWYRRMNDSLQIEIFNEVQNAFSDFTKPQQQLTQLFQHLKYYDNTFSTPRVITLANNVDYRNKTIVTDTLLLIDLINYLGENHKFYQNQSRFISENMKASQIVPDLVDAYGKKYSFQERRKTLLDEMIYFGKVLYFKDVMIPDISDAEKIGYSELDLEWAKLNETQIWSYFVEREMLFDSDPKLIARFIALAPFSKFYLELDSDSPGRIGHYIGWQIVRAYAERTGYDVFKILQTEADEIFNNSKYKPKQ
jgi:gliding motility-associated lipoprotein GldB